MAKKYRALKFGGDDLYSWAVFHAKDIKGLRSPISDLGNIKPLVSGCMRKEAYDYVKTFEEADNKK